MQIGVSGIDTSAATSVSLQQQYVLMGQLGCATPKSIPQGGKTILISKQKFNSVLGQNKSPEVVAVPPKPA